MLTLSRPKGRRLQNRSLGLLLAVGAGIGMFAATTGTASAALQNSDGSLIPVHVQTGSANLPNGTVSVLTKVNGSSTCKNVDIAPGSKVGWIMAAGCPCVASAAASAPMEIGRGVRAYRGVPQNAHARGGGGSLYCSITRSAGDLSAAFLRALSPQEPTPPQQNRTVNRAATQHLTKELPCRPTGEQ